MAYLFHTTCISVLITFYEVFLAEFGKSTLVRVVSLMLNVVMFTIGATVSCYVCAVQRL